MLVERRVRQLAKAGVSEVVAPATGEVIDVQRAIAALPRRQRETAVLRFVLELDTREVAQVLGVDEGTVKSHLARARAKLVDALAVPDVEVSDARD